ncbi:MAG: methylmalonyl-CoA mutase, partial [Bacillota bacterium]
NTLVPKVVEQLKAKGMGDVLVLVGGIIPEDDVPLLQSAGVAGSFGPGTSTDDIIAFTRDHVRRT